MTAPTWLRSLLGRKKNPLRKNKIPRHRVEELETRLTPASHTWTGAISGSWSDAGNWDAVNGAPTAAVSGVVLFFGSATTLSMVDDIVGLNVDALNFSASGYTLSGTTGGIVLNLTGLGGNPAISDSAGGNILSATNLSINLLAASQISVGAGSDTISAAIGGSFGINKLGSGTLVLAGQNTYTDVTTISAGTIKLGAAGTAPNGPLGTTAGGTIVASGATLDLNGISLANAEPLTISGAGVGGIGALTNSSGTAATYGGLLALGADASIIAGAGNILLTNAGTINGTGFNLTLSGTATGCTLASIINTGTGSVTKNGTGTWIVSGANTFTGAVNLNAGVFATPSFAVNGTAQPLGKGTAVNFNGGTLRAINTPAGSLANWAPTLTFGASGGTIDTSTFFVFFGGTFAGSGQMTVINSTGANAAWVLVTSASPGFSGNIVIGGAGTTGNQSGIQYRSNLANPFGTGSITINTGGLLTADTVAGGTVPNAITLNGGILGTQSTSVTSSGNILVAANSLLGSPPRRLAASTARPGRSSSAAP